jgi:hypothetical protein
MHLSKTDTTGCGFAEVVANTSPHHAAGSFKRTGFHLALWFSKSMNISRKGAKAQRIQFISLRLCVRPIQLMRELEAGQDCLSDELQWRKQQDVGCEMRTRPA